MFWFPKKQPQNSRIVHYAITAENWRFVTSKKFCGIHTYCVRFFIQLMLTKYVFRPSFLCKNRSFQWYSVGSDKFSKVCRKFYFSAQKLKKFQFRAFGPKYLYFILFLTITLTHFFNAHETMLRRTSLALVK